MYAANTETLILDLLTLSITPESVEFESQVFPPVSRSPVQKRHCSHSVLGGYGQEDGASPLPQSPVSSPGLWSLPLGGQVPVYLTCPRPGLWFLPLGGQVPVYLTCPRSGLQKLCSQWVQSVRLRLPPLPGS